MKRNRRTISNDIIIEGIGLHKGKKNTLILKPNISSHGILFKNPDNGNEIFVDVENISGVERGTVISNGNFEVSTIEHLLSTLFVFEIDDLIIEINGNEVPIMDGSASIFAEMVLKAGIIEKEETVDYFTVDGDMEFISDDTYYKIEKSSGFKVDCVYENEHPLIGLQRVSIEINIENYIKEIAPARTFGFDYEIEWLRKNGLALGGSLDNAVVITKDGVLNKEGLRFKDEFVRHKILDLLGDLKLCGLRFSDIKITAIKPSHKTNYELAKFIKARSEYGKAK